MTIWMQKSLRAGLMSVVLVLGAGAAQPAAPAAPATSPTAPATQPADPRVPALLKQLGSDEFKLRREAEEKLIAIGEGALPALKALVAETKDQEVRTRAAAAVRTIEESLDNGPTLITLHLKDAPIDTAIAEISRQANVEIATWPPNNARRDQGKVTIDVDKQPFWMVMRTLAESTNWTPERMGNGDKITLMQQGGAFAKRPFVAEGCYLVTAGSFSRQESIDFANPQNPSRSCSIRLQIYVDPKLTVLQGGRTIDIENAVDDQGKSMALPRQQGNRYGGGWGSNWVWDLDAPLAYTPGAAKKIAEIRGKAHLNVLTKAEKWEIENPLKAADVNRTVPGTNITLTIKGFAKKGSEGNYEMQLQMAHPTTIFGGNVAHPVLDYNTLQQSLRVVDAKGKAYMRSGGGGGGGGGKYSYSFTFSGRDEQGKPLGEPDKIIFNVPVEVKDVPVSFEFKDLPLP